MDSTGYAHIDNATTIAEGKGFWIGRDDDSHHVWFQIFVTREVPVSTLDMSRQHALDALDRLRMEARTDPQFASAVAHLEREIDKLWPAL